MIDRKQGTIMATDLVKKLQFLIEEHGDQPVGLSGTYGGMTLTAIDDFEPTYTRGGEDHPVTEASFKEHDFDDEPDRKPVVDSFTFFFDD